MSRRDSQELDSNEAMALVKRNRANRAQKDLERDYANLEHSAGPWLEIEPRRRRSSRSVRKSAARKVQGALLKNRYLRKKSLKKAYANMEKSSMLGGRKKHRKTRKSFWF